MRIVILFNKSNYFYCVFIVLLLYTEPVKYPCEERLLTHKVLSDYGSLFSKEEAKEFNELLKRWKYGAARQETDIRRANAAATAANRSSSRTRTFPPSSAPQVFWA